MNKTISESISLANSLKRSLYDIPEIEIVVCPPFPSLSDVKEVLLDSNIKLGAQDVYWEKEGAYTGEVSSAMLKDAGCEYCIVGHSERRQYFGETNETVNRKAKALLAEGIKAIVCVGERVDERKAGRTFDVVKDHVENSLSGISKEEMLNIVIAYEPVWAIGTGLNATGEQAEEVHKYIRGLLSMIYGEETAKQIRIQYGGSVKPENIKELIEKPDVDGALIGGASLKTETFTKIIKNCLR